MTQNKAWDLVFTILLCILIAFSSGCLKNEKAIVIDIGDINTTENLM